MKRCYETPEIVVLSVAIEEEILNEEGFIDGTTSNVEVSKKPLINR